MAHQHLELPTDAVAALEQIRETSRHAYVLVFKKSPICPVSRRAEQELRSWLGAIEGEQALALAEIDVIAQRELARGLTRELEIAHQSPQALLFANAQLTWHGSHAELTAERFADLIPPPPS